MDVITYLVANGISFFWRQALEMAGCPYLYEEDEAEQDADFVRSGQVGAEQKTRQRHDDKGRKELAQVEGCGEQGHDGGGGVAASLDAGDGVQIGYTHAVGDAYKDGADENHNDGGNEIGGIAKQ